MNIKILIQSLFQEFAIFALYTNSMYVAMQKSLLLTLED